MTKPIELRRALRALYETYGMDAVVEEAIKMRKANRLMLKNHRKIVAASEYAYTNDPGYRKQCDDHDAEEALKNPPKPNEKLKALMEEGRGMILKAGDL